MSAARHSWTRRLAALLAVLAMCVASRSSWGYSTLDSKAYVQDGLIAQWDGIDNVLSEGVRSHDSSSTVWSDLTGNGHDFALSSYIGSQITGFSDNSLKAKSCYFVPCANPDGVTNCKNYKTIEICAKHGGSGVYQCLFNSGDGLKKFCAVKKGTVQFYNAGNQNYAIGSGSAFQAACVHDSASDATFTVYTNGVVATQTASDTWGGNSSGTCLGRGANTYQYTGEYYAIRLYDRPLTAAELAANASIDQRRFLGADGGMADMLVISSEPANVGTVSPACNDYLGFSVGEQVTCTASASWTSDDGKTKATCTGYKVYTNGVVMVSGAGNEFTYTHPDCPTGAKLVWQWDVDLLVTATAGTGGSVEPSSRWVGSGESVVVTAKVANAETTGFVQWSGDCITSANKYERILTIDNVTSPIALTATFGTWGATRTWTGAGADNLASTAENWSDNTAPTALDSVKLDGATDAAQKAMTWDLDIPVSNWAQIGYTNAVTFATVYSTEGFHTFCVRGDVNLTTGIWKHKSNTSDNKKTYRLCLRIDGDMSIGSAAKIDVDGLGYQVTYNAESATIGSGNHGGSYGGRGQGNSDSPYGRFYAPDDLGSGSTANWVGAGSGGSVRLVIGGALTHQGTISSSGTPNSWGHYGASGGSIWMTARSISGSGKLVAGAQNHNYPGSGGRIAVILTGEDADFSNYDILNQASALAEKAGCSAPGTIYAETAADTPNEGWLILKGDGTARSSWLYYATPFSKQVTSAHFSRLTVTNNIYMSVETGMTLDLRGTKVVTADKSGVSNGLYFNGGTVVIPDDRFDLDYRIVSPAGWSPAVSAFNILEGGELYVHTKAATITGNLMVTNGATVIATKPLTVDGNVRLDGGTMRTVEPLADPAALDLTVTGDMFIATNGSMTVVGKGYKAGYGPTKAGGNAGGSHGGQGWNNGSGDSSSKPYDDIRNPTMAGAGGGWQAGGGIILLSVSGELHNDGKINASGTYTSGHYRGAGGTANVTCGSLRGKGIILADADEYEGGSDQAQGAGGGRVAVRVTKTGETFDAYRAAGGRFTAYGSRTSTTSKAGGAGTIYLRTAADALDEGTLIVDNKSKSNTSNVTPLGGDVTGLGVGSVIITNGAKLKLADNTTFVVKGGWSCLAGASFTAGAGSVVEFAGMRDAEFSGATTFANLTCSQGGKRFLFADGAKLTTTENLNVVGASGNRASMQSVSAGGTWTLDASAGGAILNEVNLSDCRSVSEITVMSGTGTNNDKVTFVNVTPGETITWTGAKSTAWGDSGNWTTVHDGARVPVATDNVVIPSGRAVYPEMSVSAAMKTLTVESEASLSVGSATVTVSGSTTLAGAISATTGGFVFGGDVSWTGTFESESSTVVFNGTAQSFTASASKYSTISFSGTSLALQNSLTCVTLAIGNGTAATELAVAEGATVKATFFTVSGDADEKNVTLRCLAADKFWKLVGVKNTVSGATVSGSDASKGVAVVPTDSVGSGENPNWYFVDTRTHYSGGTWPALTETTELVIDADIAATLPGDSTVGSLTLSEGASLQVSSSLTVKGPVTLENDATIVWDTPGTIDGSLTLLDGSVLTHTVNDTTEKYKLNLTIGGDGYISDTASVNVTAKGHSGGAAGPGGSLGGNVGASHGGRGISGGGTPRTCYGSVFCPTNLGSCGTWQTQPGGGAAILSFGGALILDGSIQADCGTGSGYYSGSGGSVNLTCAALSGAGTISACGGRSSSGNNNLGGGGRVAVILTEQATLAPFTGAVNTYAGTYGDAYTANGGGGTFYLETSTSRKAGTVYLQNKAEITDGMKTDLIDIPSSRYNADTRSDWRNATLHLRLNAKVNLLSDLSVAGLEREGGTLLLNGHTLSVYSKRPKTWPKKSVPSWVTPGTDAAGNPGQILFPSGLMLIVR